MTAVAGTLPPMAMQHILTDAATGSSLHVLQCWDGNGPAQGMIEMRDASGRNTGIVGVPAEQAPALLRAVAATLLGQHWGPVDDTADPAEPIVALPLSLARFLSEEAPDEHRSCLPPCPWGELHTVVEQAPRKRRRPMG